MHASLARWGGRRLSDAPIAIGVDYTACPNELTLEVDVTNRGAAAVAAGTEVSFYADEMGTRVLLGVVPIDVALPPGGVSRVTFTVPIAAAGRSTSIRIVVVVDDDGTGAGRDRECDETNNTAATLDVECIGLM